MDQRLPTPAELFERSLVNRRKVFGEDAEKYRLYRKASVATVSPGEPGKPATVCLDGRPLPKARASDFYGGRSQDHRSKPPGNHQRRWNNYR